MNREDRKDLHLNTVDNLSQLIRQHLIEAAYQQYTPSSDPDKADSIIADGQRKAKELRRLREEFENITTGIISFC